MFVAQRRDDFGLGVSLPGACELGKIIGQKHINYRGGPPHRGLKQTFFETSECSLQRTDPKDT